MAGREARAFLATRARLELSRTHANMQNKGLRERIYRLRKDRVIFDNVYKRLERCLHEKKNEMVRRLSSLYTCCPSASHAPSHRHRRK